MFRLGDRRPLFEIVAGCHPHPFPEFDLGHEVVLGHPAKVLTDCLGPCTGRRGGHPRSWAFAASCWTEAAAALPAERVASWPSTSGTQLLSPGARHVQTMRTGPVSRRRGVRRHPRQRTRASAMQYLGPRARLRRRPSDDRAQQGALRESSQHSGLPGTRPATAVLRSSTGADPAPRRRGRARTLGHLPAPGTAGNLVSRPDLVSSIAPSRQRPDGLFRPFASMAAGVLDVL